jgi:hypothetical protein
LQNSILYNATNSGVFTGELNVICPEDEPVVNSGIVSGKENSINRSIECNVLTGNVNKINQDSESSAIICGKNNTLSTCTACSINSGQDNNLSSCINCSVLAGSSINLTGCNNSSILAGTVAFPSCDNTAGTQNLRTFRTVQHSASIITNNVPFQLSPPSDSQGNHIVILTVDGGSVILPVLSGGKDIGQELYISISGTPIITVTINQPPGPPKYK